MLDLLITMINKMVIENLDPKALKSVTPGAHLEDIREVEVLLKMEVETWAIQFLDRVMTTTKWNNMMDLKNLLMVIPKTMSTEPNEQGIAFR